MSRYGAFLLLCALTLNLCAMDESFVGHYHPYNTEDINRFDLIKDSYQQINIIFNDYKNSTPTAINDIFAELIMQIYEREQHILHFMSMYRHIPLSVVDKVYIILYEYNKMKRYLMEL